MNEASKNIIRVVIAIKLLLLMGMIISITVIGYQQFTFRTSDFPEHRDFFREQEGVALSLFLFLIPLALSLVVDFKEVKMKGLKGKWYILTLLLLIGYTLIRQLQGHYLVFFVATGMAVALVLIIRKQNRKDSS
ncbi:MAG TPA: hypothetical protein VIU12_17415 [Chryseolinea sp.]